MFFDAANQDQNGDIFGGGADYNDMFPCFTTDDEDMLPESAPIPRALPMSETLFLPQKYNKPASVAAQQPQRGSPYRAERPPNQVSAIQHQPNVSQVPYYGYVEDLQEEEYISNPMPMGMPVIIHQRPPISVNSRQLPFEPAVRSYGGGDHDEEETRLRQLELEALKDLQMINQVSLASSPPNTPEKVKQTTSLSSIDNPSDKENEDTDEERKQRLEEEHGDEQEVKEDEESPVVESLEKVVVVESKEEFWEGRKDADTWKQLDELFAKNTEQPLVPSKDPLPVTESTTVPTTPTPIPLFELPALWEEKEEPPPPQETEYPGELVEITIGEEEETESEEEEEDEESEEEEEEPPRSAYRAPSLSASTFERYSVAATTPIAVKIVIEYVETGTVGRIVWSWPYKEWPICAWLEFEFPDGRIEVFETRLGDQCIYMGVRRYQSEECQSLDLCKEGIIDEQQCLLLYKKCQQFRTDLESVHYDVICEYINTIPRYGKKFAAWWRKYVRRQGKNNYLTSHQLVFMVLADAFPTFGADHLSAFYSISDFFEYIIKLKQQFSSPSSPSNAGNANHHYDDELSDPYAASSSSTASGGTLCKEEV